VAVGDDVGAGGRGKVEVGGDMVGAEVLNDALGRTLHAFFDARGDVDGEIVFDE